MNWVRENKFLTGFLAVLIIGVGALSYLLYTAYGSWADETDQFNQQAGELHRLKSLSPYPNRKNLDRYQAERDGLIKATQDLASSLAQMELPPGELSPSAFQDRLRDTISTVKDKAGRMGVRLPDNFSMDFEQYESQPPPAAAAGPLGRQLAAINLAVNLLLDQHVDAIAGLVRTRLPQEGAAAGGGRGERRGGGFGPRGGAGGGGAGELVEKLPIDLTFLAGQTAFQKVLNAFAASSQQYFITRTLVVENTNPNPVLKSTDSTQPAPAAGAPGGGNYLTYIVGTEKLKVAMRVDIVSFNPPDKALEARGGPAR